MHNTRDAQFAPVVMAAFTEETLDVVSTEVAPNHLALVLLHAAQSFSYYVCPDEDCEGCNAFRLAYWKLDSMLPSHIRREYQKTLRDSGTPLPDAPWEEVE